jgi:chromosome segregation ATPase
LEHDNQRGANPPNDIWSNDIDLRPEIDTTTSFVDIIVELLAAHAQKYHKSAKDFEDVFEQHFNSIGKALDKLMKTFQLCQEKRKLHQAIDDAQASTLKLKTEHAPHKFDHYDGYEGRQKHTKDNVQLRNDIDVLHSAYKDWTVVRGNLIQGRNKFYRDIDELQAVHDEVIQHLKELYRRHCTLRDDFLQLRAKTNEEKFRCKVLEGHIIGMDRIEFGLRQENEVMRLAMETKNTEIEELQEAKQSRAKERNDAVLRKMPVFLEVRKVLKGCFLRKELNKISLKVVDAVHDNVRDTVLVRMDAFKVVEEVLDGHVPEKKLKDCHYRSRCHSS